MYIQASLYRGSKNIRLIKMFNVIRSFASAVGRSSGRARPKRSRPKFMKKQKLKTMPIFKYPMSKPGTQRVYVWGLQEHGALGTVKTISFAEESVAYSGFPHRLTFGEYKDVIDIATGYGFTAFAVKSKDHRIVYGSGINTDSQLGFHPRDDKLKVPIIPEPRPIFIPLKNKTAKVLGLAAGRAHLLILTDEGLYTLGNNGYGQCGRPIINNEDYLKSRAVHFIPDVKGTKIKAVAAGQDHSMIINEKGEVYAFGWGADGQTGLAHYRNEYRPSLVKGDLAGENIVKLACTADCVLALSDKGTVFGWGNTEYSQIPAISDSQQINIATEVKMCRGLGQIIDIASGGSFCMVLNNEGDVFVWGFGILGLGPEVQRVGKPTLIPKTLFGVNAYEPHTKVVKIFSGISQLGAITNQGNLYMWGRNKYGALGLGHRNDQYFPLKVSIGAMVKKICCGIDHTVSLCKPFV